MDEEKTELLNLPIDAVDTIEAEKWFHDWVVNSKSLNAIAKQYSLNFNFLNRVRRKFKWDERKEKITNKVSDQNDKIIEETKKKLLDTSVRLVDIANKNIEQFLKEDGKVVKMTAKGPTVTPFIKSAYDFKTVVEAFFLALNDGVEKKHLDVDQRNQLEITDQKAAKMLELLAEDDRIIDADIEELSQEPKLIEETNGDETS